MNTTVLSRFLAAAASILLIAAGAHAGGSGRDEVAQVRAAVAGLYRVLAAGDAAALDAYVPARGFTEFSPPEGTLKTLDREYFRRAFAAGVRIDLHVEGDQVRVQGDSATVAGYRQGTITLADGKRLEVRDCMTMVWSLESKAWMLRHVHISACAAPS